MEAGGRGSEARDRDRSGAAAGLGQGHQTPHGTLSLPLGFPNTTKAGNLVTSSGAFPFWGGPRGQQAAWALGQGGHPCGGSLQPWPPTNDGTPLSNTCRLTCSPVLMGRQDLSTAPALAAVWQQSAATWEQALSERVPEAMPRSHSHGGASPPDPESCPQHSPPPGRGFRHHTFGSLAATP